MKRQTNWQPHWAIAMVLIGTGSAALAQGSAETISLWLENGGKDTEIARTCAFGNPQLNSIYKLYRDHEFTPKQQIQQEGRKTRYFQQMCNCAIRERKVSSPSGVPECALSKQ